MDVASNQASQVAVGFREEVNRLVHHFLFGGVSATLEPFPGTSVRDRGEAIEVVAELPGVAVEDLEVSVEGTLLTLRGGSHEQRLDDGAPLRRGGRGYGSFMRCIELPAAVDSDRGEAKLTGGVLTVTLPKLARTLRR